MFLKSTYNEFIKIAAKPRSYIGIGAITLIIAIILFAMKMDGKMYISFITAPFEQSLSFEGNILNGNLMRKIPRGNNPCCPSYRGCFLVLLHKK